MLPSVYISFAGFLMVFAVVFRGSELNKTPDQQPSATTLTLSWITLLAGSFMCVAGSFSALGFFVYHFLFGG
jgi:hypothetical protein